MTSHLSDGDLRALLPAHLHGDPAFSPAIEALRPHLQAVARAVPNLLIFARLGGQQPETMLPPLRRLVEARGGLRPAETALLEQLAWQLHVDFREAARTDAELADLVLRSIAWHRIKGTPAGLRAALELCGFPGVRIEEDGSGDYWAAYQLGLPDVPDLDALQRIVTIAREMQPARCRLWRMYNDGYDRRPGIWSGGAPAHAWSCCWWSSYSGIPVPGIPGMDDAHDLVVSFGRRDVLHAEPYFTGRVGWGLTELLCFLIPYIDRPIWSRTAWSDIFNRKSAFVLGELFGTLAGDRITSGGVWDDEPWNAEPWGVTLGWGRREPAWQMTGRRWARSQAVFSWPESAPACGLWGDINSNYGVPLVRRIVRPAPRWSAFRWSEDVCRVELLRILEQFHHVRPVQGAALRPAVSTGGMVMTALRALPAAYIDRPVWGLSRWGDVLPRRHGFSGVSLLGTLSGERRTAPGNWSGLWNGRPWRVTLGWERPEPAWQMHGRQWPRSQAVYSSPGESAPASGLWGDINSNYGVPTYSFPAPAPRWSASRWSDAAPPRHTVRVLEQRRATLPLTTARVCDAWATGASPGATRATAWPRIRCRNWRGPWDGQRWNLWLLPARISGILLWNELHDILHTQASGVTRLPDNLFGRAA